MSLSEGSSLSESLSEGSSLSESLSEESSLSEGSSLSDGFRFDGKRVLVVGGEVGGVPPALGSGARAVAVPLVPGVDSLNVAVAGSILMCALTGASEAGADG